MLLTITVVGCVLLSVVTAALARSTEVRHHALVALVGGIALASVCWGMR